MCDKYVTPEPSDAQSEFGVTQPWWRLSPSFNVYPGRNVPVVRMHAGDTEGVVLRWGLIPDWAEADASKACASAAPAESMEQSNVLRGAWERGQRCILPMAGFYAWQLTPQRYRQPYFIRVDGKRVFGVAALWDRTVAEEDDDVIESCALLTVPANPLMAEVNSPIARMPAIVEPKDYRTWLTAAAPAARTVLRPFPAKHLTAHAISPRINSKKYDDAQLVLPVDAYALARQPDPLKRALAG